MRMLGYAAVIVGLVAGMAAGETGEAPHLERIEWTDVWVVDANTEAQPRVLLVGDSIVKGYYGDVEKALAGQASCARYATSLFLGNPDYLAELEVLLERYPFAVIHINNGLHGWDYTEGEYEAALAPLYALIERCAPQATVIWATTTPVRDRDDLSKLDDAKTERVKVRNQSAVAHAQKRDVPVNDLYALVVDHPEYFAQDGVHYNPQGRAAQGAAVAKAVKEALGN